jgi:hypothetical protein
MTGTTTRRSWLAVSLLAGLALACLSRPVLAAEDKPQEGVIHQLRIYEIFDDTKQAFHQRFRDHAMRIMARHDFRIVSMWESRSGDRTEFVYLLEWPDEATMKDRWAKFMADQEWSDIKQRTRAQGRMVGEIQDRTLRLTDYSPRSVPAEQP